MIILPDPEFKLAIEGMLLSIVAIFGLIGNTLAIVVLSRPSMKSPINVILIGNIQKNLKNSLCNYIYREFSPYANFITANFITAVFQNYYENLANAILWAIYFVTAYIK